MTDTNKAKGTNNMLIPTKDKTTGALIIDALRILTWKQWKADKEVRGLENYENFKEIWKEQEIHNYSLDKLMQFVKELGYTVKELETMRETYYTTNKTNQKEGINNFTPDW